MSNVARPSQDEFQQSRRSFLRRAALAGTATTVAQLWTPPLAVAEERSPNEKLNIGCIGVAARGASNVSGVATENIVALCDIDAKRLDGAAAKYPKADKYLDFRRLLERTDLDAVVVSTPDHTHALPVLGAIGQGLDVYCEKPLAHSVYEVRKIRDAAKQHGTVTQMGTQIHALDNYRRVVEIIQSGMLGPVTRVHVWLGRGSIPAGKRVAQGTPPAHVDYDLWTGPAPLRPFHESHFHFQWRYWWDFGGGTLADFGCHYMDLPFWALELKAPTTVVSQGEKTYQGENEVPDRLRVDYAFAGRRGQPPVHLTWYHGDTCPDWVREYKKDGAGVLFEGERGRVLADYTTRKVFLDDGTEPQLPLGWIPNSAGHHQEWIQACKTRGGTTCNFDYSGNLAEAVLLGNVSYRAGQKKLEWDAQRLIATNCPEAAPFIQREYRAGWEV